jgi:tRNA threonylcarbamoyladenosine biosynthesis protein TsaB
VSSPPALHLGLDTATPFLALALWSPEAGVLAENIELVERAHAVRLIASLEETFGQAGVSRSELTAISCGAGPGSYTGLRVGAAAALGLARSLAVPLSGCDTLAAIAFRGLADGEEGLAAIDARRGTVYLGRYRRRGNEVVTVAAPHKTERSRALEEHPGLRLIEASPPDPGYIARQAAAGQPFAPVYL